MSNQANQPNEDAHSLLSHIDEVKQKLTDEEYKKLVEGLATIQKKQTEIKRYLVSFAKVNHHLQQVDDNTLNVCTGIESANNIYYLPTGLADAIKNSIKKNGFTLSNLCFTGSTEQKTSFMWNQPNPECECEHDCTGMIQHNIEVSVDSLTIITKIEDAPVPADD